MILWILLSASALISGCGRAGVENPVVPTPASTIESVLLPDSGEDVDPDAGVSMPVPHTP